MLTGNQSASARESAQEIPVAKTRGRSDEDGEGCPLDIVTRTEGRAAKEMTLAPGHTPFSDEQAVASLHRR